MPLFSDCSVVLLRLTNNCFNAKRFKFETLSVFLLSMYTASKLWFHTPNNHAACHTLFQVPGLNSMIDSETEGQSQSFFCFFQFSPFVFRSATMSYFVAASFLFAIFLPTPTAGMTIRDIDIKPSGSMQTSLGLIGDYCSVNDSCRDGLNCYSPESGLCDTSSIYCVCTPREGENGAGCQLSSECIDPSETCVTDTTSNQTSCVSCNVALTYVFHQPIEGLEETERQCRDNGNTVPRPFPTYVEPPNGLTFDRCELDVDCRGPLDCYDVSAGQNPTPCSPNSETCRCLDTSSGFKNCASSEDCQRGEVCSSTTGNEWEGTACVSMIYSQETNSSDLTILPPLPVYGSGVTGDQCNEELDCEKSLACTHTDHPYGMCRGRTGCTCQPLRNEVCTETSDCERAGEMCVNVPGSVGKAFCKSRKTMQDSLYYKEVGKSSPEPTPTIFPTNGWIQEACSTDDDCVIDRNFERVCMHLQEEYGFCNERPMCFCKPLVQPNNSSTTGMRQSGPSECKQASDCGNGESCVAFSGSIHKLGSCRSTEQAKMASPGTFIFIGGETPAPSPSMTYSSDPGQPSKSSDASPDSEPTPEYSPSTTTLSPSPLSSQVTVGPEESVESDICIDANLLSHLPAENLVFPTHRRANVLCDTFESCATPGHIVEYRGQGMMMRTYCQKYSPCTRNTRLVNSPKFAFAHRFRTSSRVALNSKFTARVASRTDGLLFTPLAARFETRFEEAVLQAISRLILKF